MKNIDTSLSDFPMLRAPASDCISTDKTAQTFEIAKPTADRSHHLPRESDAGFPEGGLANAASTFVILGNGSSGRAAAALAARLGYGTVTLDGADVFPNGALDGAIVSPGIALDHPWQAACRARAIPAKSELQFGCEELKRRGWRLLAVTGSKGKSSVVKLVADALNLAGRQAVPCGNYGLPVCELANGFRLDVSSNQTIKQSNNQASPRWAVVEVSSFQMETTVLPADTFAAAAVLNLQEDHLDRHGSVAVYHALKRRLLDFAGERIVGSEPTADEAALLSGSYFDNEVLRTNGACAVRLLRAAGLDDTAIAAAFAAFEPLPHRMKTVGVFGGVTCIDDSKATSLAALAAGVRMAGARVRLVAGGLPKGDDPRSVRGDLTARVKKVYLIGQSAELFASAWSGSVACEICGTMDRAVHSAMCEAEAGETILLSPGTASFDQFHSFGERGDVFADLIKKEGIDK